MTATEQALARLRAADPATGDLPNLPAVPVVAGSTDEAAVLELSADAERPSRRRWVAPIAIAACIAGVAVGVVLVRHHSPRHTPPAQPSFQTVSPGDEAYGIAFGLAMDVSIPAGSSEQMPMAFGQQPTASSVTLTRTVTTTTLSAIQFVHAIGDGHPLGARSCGYTAHGASALLSCPTLPNVTAGHSASLTVAAGPTQGQIQATISVRITWVPFVIAGVTSIEATLFRGGKASKSAVIAAKAPSVVASLNTGLHDYLVLPHWTNSPVTPNRDYLVLRNAAGEVVATVIVGLDGLGQGVNISLPDGTLWQVDSWQQIDTAVKQALGR